MACYDSDNSYYSDDDDHYETSYKPKSKLTSQPVYESSVDYYDSEDDGEEYMSHNQQQHTGIKSHIRSRVQFADTNQIQARDVVYQSDSDDELVVIDRNAAADVEVYHTNQAEDGTNPEMTNKQQAMINTISMTLDIFTPQEKKTIYNCALVEICNNITISLVHNGIEKAFDIKLTPCTRNMINTHKKLPNGKFAIKDSMAVLNGWRYYIRKPLLDMYQRRGGDIRNVIMNTDVFSNFDEWMITPTMAFVACIIVRNGMDLVGLPADPIQTPEPIYAKDKNGNPFVVLEPGKIKLYKKKISYIIDAGFPKSFLNRTEMVEHVLYYLARWYLETRPHGIPIDDNEEGDLRPVLEFIVSQLADHHDRCIYRNIKALFDIYFNTFPNHYFCKDTKCVYPILEDGITLGEEPFMVYDDSKCFKKTRAELHPPKAPVDNYDWDATSININVNPHRRIRKSRKAIDEAYHQKLSMLLENDATLPNEACMSNPAANTVYQRDTEHEIIYNTDGTAIIYDPQDTYRARIQQSNSINHLEQHRHQNEQYLSGNHSYCTPSTKKSTDTIPSWKHGRFNHLKTKRPSMRPDMTMTSETTQMTEENKPVEIVVTQTGEVVDAKQAVNINNIDNVEVKHQFDYNTLGYSKQVVTNDIAQSIADGKHILDVNGTITDTTTYASMQSEIIPVVVTDDRPQITTHSSLNRKHSQFGQIATDAIFQAPMTNLNNSNVQEIKNMIRPGDRVNTRHGNTTVANTRYTNLGNTVRSTRGISKPVPNVIETMFMVNAIEACIDQEDLCRKYLREEKKNNPDQFLDDTDYEDELDPEAYDSDVDNMDDLPGTIPFKHSKKAKKQDIYATISEPIKKLKDEELVEIFNNPTNNNICTLTAVTDEVTGTRAKKLTKKATKTSKPKKLKSNPKLTQDEEVFDQAITQALNELDMADPVDDQQIKYQNVSVVRTIALDVTIQATLVPKEQ